MSGIADSGARGAPAWAELLAEFARLPPVMDQLPPDRRARRVVGIGQHPLYCLLEQLVTDLTVVYSPPKVGSATISATAARHPTVPREPEHVHCLSPGGIAFLETQITRAISDECAAHWRTQLALCRWARTLLSVNLAVRAAGLATVRKPFLIAGVREPVAQYLSMVFHFSWAYVPTPQDLTADLIRARMADDPVRQWHDDWFRDELECAFGVDVYARPFPTDRGWDVYESDAARVLVVRQENLTHLPAALGALYGVDPAGFEVDTRNTAGDKAYGAHYADVKRALRLSEPELDAAYSRPYVRHFYSPCEIEAFKARWRAGAGDRSPPDPVPPAPAATGPTPAPADRNPAPGRPPARRHSGTCRPCSECDGRLRQIALLEQTCEERLALLRRLDAALRSSHSLFGKCRSLVRRVFGRSPAAR